MPATAPTKFVPPSVPPTARTVRLLRVPAFDAAAGSPPLDGEHDMPAVSAAIDQAVHSTLARLTGGLSPAALADAWFDWGIHIAFSPGKQAALAVKAMRKNMRLGQFAFRSLMKGETAEPCIAPLPQDGRSGDPAWHSWPFDFV